MQISIDAIDWKWTRHRGIALFPVYRDPESGDSVVLIRMEPGCGYPRHRHVRDETILVLHGAYRDEAGEYATGTRHVHPAGSVHEPVALEGEVPCVLLATALGGIEVLSP